MSGEFSINIIGLDEINKAIQEEADDIAKRKMRRAGLKAMEVVLDDAVKKAEAFDDPDSPASVYKNIAMTSRYDRQNGTLTVSVGVRGGARYRRGDKKNSENVTHWRFIEFGTQKMQARPFLRPALANNTNELLSAFVENMRKQFSGL